MPVRPTAENIHKRLKNVTAKPTDDPYPGGFFDSPPSDAAVLIPFFEHNDQWNLFFIRRTEGVNDRHPGQVAFPGGRTDVTDRTSESTALREAWEEIGLAADDVQILGNLNTFLTVSNYLVTPVVGIIPWPYALRLAPDEVARAFSIPLIWLADPENYAIRVPEFRGRPFIHEVIYYKPYSGELLWGVTARIVANLVSTLGIGADD